jgi:hypothetical protein
VDAGSCPACEASKRSENRELIPIYFADAIVHDELCTYCGDKLADRALQRATEHTPNYDVHHVTHAKGRPVLEFDRRPPA